jgi:hypothetical protein
MGKYSDLITNVFSVFALPAWKSTGLETVPQGFVGVQPPPYIRVSILASGDSINSVSTSGIIIADIFTINGMGPAPAAVIADQLDLFLLGKSFSYDGSVTQVAIESNFRVIGPDTENNSLCRSVYQAQFNHFKSQGT